MNIAIVHYHLNRGGVTQVVRNHLLALDAISERDQHIRAAILFGGRKQGWNDDLPERLNSVSLKLCPIPRLDYDPRPDAEPEALAAEMRSQLQRLEFSPGETVLHVHNHSIGKNASLPGALRILAQEGYSVLLQIHDFAEDFRPDHYRLLQDAIGREFLNETLYPQAAQTHYAVLNRRDFSILKQAGVDESRLHYLPNPIVPASEEILDKEQARRKLHDRCNIARDQQYVLYPVRGIRRKNLGEALLWSLLAGNSTVVGITLAPMNPAEQVHYTVWKKLAAELGLACCFETGEEHGLGFAENLAAADLMLTTSVAEGFGMVFLESWLSDRHLAGRNLPEITSDFVSAGMRYYSIYDRLNVPIEWIGRDEFAELFQSHYNRILNGYDFPAVHREELESLLDEKIQENLVDFADLNEPLQEKVIRNVAGHSNARNELKELNPTLSDAANTAMETITHNKRRIEQTYSLIPSGHRLQKILQTVATSSRGDWDSGLKNSRKILEIFLDPTRFRLIRS
jgi:glycosyltransferase involved in cell wall biosynthesis